MGPAIVLAVVVTAIACVAVAAKRTSYLAGVPSVVVLALPIAMLSFGYAAGIGMTVIWAVVATAATVLGVVGAAVVLTKPIGDSTGRGNGLISGAGALISVGLAAAAAIWVSSIIAAFSELNQLAVEGVLIAAGLAIALGRRGGKLFSRLALVIAVIAAVLALIVGIVGGAPANLGSPQVAVPAVPVMPGILYAIAIILIGAAHPGLRRAGALNKRSVVIAAFVTGAIALCTMVGVLALSGGSLILPALLVDLVPAFSPAIVGLLVCACAAAVGSIVVGYALYSALTACSELFAKQDFDDESEVADSRSAAIGIVIALAAFGFAALNAELTYLVIVIAILSIAALWCTWRHAKSTPTQDPDPTRNEPALAKAGS